MIKQLFQFQIEALKSEEEMFKALIYKLYGEPDSIQVISLCVNTILQDLIFENFGIEEEDQMEAMKSPQIMMDEEIRGMFPQISAAIESLFLACGIQPQMGGGEMGF